MKISKNILESIIRQIIREEYRLADYEGDPNRQFAEGYLLVAQATTSRFWGEEVTKLLTFTALSVANRYFGPEGDERTRTKFSPSLYHKLLSKTFEGKELKSRISNITQTALEQTSAYVSAEQASKDLASLSIDRIIEASLRALVLHELVGCVMYQLQDVMGKKVSNQYLLDGVAWKDIKTISAGSPEQVEQAVKKMLKNRESFKNVMRHAWEQIMKFVGLTHKYENSHFNGFTEIRLFGFTDKDIDTYAAEDRDYTVLSFGDLVKAPF